MGEDPLRPRDLERFARLDREATAALARAAAGGALSARGVVRVLRVARTLADLAGRGDVSRKDVLIALRWRVDINAES